MRGCLLASCAAPRVSEYFCQAHREAFHASAEFFRVSFWGPSGWTALADFVRRLEAEHRNALRAPPAPPKAP